VSASRKITTRNQREARHSSAMPPYLNPLKRSAEPEEASWSPRKRQYSASEQEEYWMVMWSVLLHSQW